MKSHYFSNSFTIFWIVCASLFFLFFIVWAVLRILTTASLVYNSNNTDYCKSHTCFPMNQHVIINHFRSTPIHIKDFTDFNIRNAYHCIEWINILYEKAQHGSDDLTPALFPGFTIMRHLYYGKTKKILGGVVMTSVLNNDVCIIFRGTIDIHDAVHDADTRQSRFLDYPSSILTHEGFTTLYSQIRSDVLNILEEIEPDGILWTGHSLGAAIAALAAFDANHHGKTLKKSSLYLFGCPRIGNPFFSNEFNNNLPNTFRVVNTEDIVNNIPLSLTVRLFKPHHPFIYQHIGEVYSFSDNRISFLLNHELQTYRSNLLRLLSTNHNDFLLKN